MLKYFVAVYCTAVISTEVDYLAEYLDQLFAVPQQTSISAIKGGLNRFRAVAKKTREIVSLVNKARVLDIHSEFRKQPYSACITMPYGQFVLPPKPCRTQILSLF